MFDPLLSSEVFSTPPSATSRGPLHSGAVWQGTQRSGRNTYDVRVTLDSVDCSQGTVSGLLEIKGLTPQLSELVTYFEGEIVGERFGFLTGRWGATESDDKKHWARFPPFRTVKDNLSKPNLTFNNSNRPFLFMRWKEQFVVPNHQAQNIHGASFAGFYFICLEFDPPDASSYSFDLVPHRNSLSPPARPTPSPFTRSISSPSPDRARVRLPVYRSNSGNLRPPSEEREGQEDEERPGRSTSPITTQVVAPRPRRASSAAFSYAAAVRGAGTPMSMSAMAAALEETGATTPSSEGTQTPTPKEDYDHSRQLALPPSPASSTSSLPALEPIMIPIPLGHSPEEFPAPSSPPLAASSPRLGTNGRSSSWGQGARRNSMSATTDEQSARGTSRPSTGRRASDVGSGERGRGGAAEAKEKQDTFGQLSWSRASMTGFYFFRHSEPYQELSLHYVPSTRGATQSYDFR